ncbi:MAG: hypothetical protein LW650_07255 [Planctomycetaceae bacterium]|jgi:hypothetical protein|nr:hypothetical protein [Phycisphaerales bacterium]MCE2653290.1 hypothetical protein [Planctomycetaceae bacterium]
MHTELRNHGLSALLAIASLTGTVWAQPAQFQVNGIPDFSQYQNPAWRNYCAPTAGADLVYWFSTSDPALRRGSPFGPGGAADNGVNANIGGVPPAAGTIAQLMGTTPAGGTSLIGCANGLDAYLEANDSLGGNANWNTQMVLAANFAAPSGQNFFTFLQQRLSSGAGVLLAVAWPNGAPGGYDVPDNYSGSDSPNAGIGHAFVMTGYNTLGAVPTISVNDPANNLLNAHNWPGENTVINLNVGMGGLPNVLTFGLGGFTGTVYGAVVTIPSPGPLGLLMIGGTLAALRRR